MRTEVFRQNWFYILYREEEKYILSVTCGTSAVFDLEILLDQDEIKSLLEKGEPFVEELAGQIRNDPDAFLHRKIRNGSRER